MTVAAKKTPVTTTKKPTTKTATAKKTKIKDVIVAKPAAIPSTPINYDSNFVPGENCVLYHVRKPLPKMTITMDNDRVSKEQIDELRDMLHARFPKMSTPKWSAIAKILYGEVDLKNREAQLDHTIAIGYNPRHNALVVAFSKANRNHEESNRAIGYKRTLARLQKAMTLANKDDIHKNPEIINVHKNIQIGIDEYINRAEMFFKDKAPTNILFYCDMFMDNGMALVMIATKKPM